MASDLDPIHGTAHSSRMAASFDTLAAADALRDAGLQSGPARAIATQLHLAAGAVEAVTRPELEAALADLKMELLERIGAVENTLENRISDVESTLGNRIGAVENSFGNRIGEVENTLGNRIGAVETTLGNRIGAVEITLGNRIGDAEQRTADLKTELLDRIAESERRHAALLWRLFGGIVAVAGLAVAAAAYLVPIVS